MRRIPLAVLPVLLLLLLLSCAPDNRPPGDPKLREWKPAEMQSMATTLLDSLSRQALPPKPAEQSRTADIDIIAVLHTSDGKGRARRYQIATSGRERLLRELYEAASKDGLGAGVVMLRIDLLRGLASTVMAPNSFERGFVGLFAHTSPPKILLPMEVPPEVVSASGKLNLTRMRALAPPGSAFSHFGTQTVFADLRGRYVSLYRDHSPLQPDRSAAESLAAAVRGGDYLLRALQPDGRFLYSYRPLQGKFGDDYNMLRHAGAVYALLQLHKATSEDRFLEGARKAIEGMLFSVEPSSRWPGTSVMLDGEAAKLGGNALALLALTEYVEITGERRMLAEMAELAEWIVRSQGPDGHFTIHKESWPEASDSGFVSEYYPGEALLALTRFYGLDRDERWLTAAQNAARYLVFQSRGDTTPVHDHWLMMGLAALDKVAPNPAYREYLKRVSSAILAAQLEGEGHPDWAGGFYEPPRSTPTDIRVEGLNAAWETALRAKDRAAARANQKGVSRALRFSRQCEIEPEVAILMAEPGFCQGGVMRGLDEPEIRIDYVQHHICALLGAYENARRAP